MLPPEAVFEATLLDVTQPDQPPVVLGRQRRQPAGQPPYALWIPYPSARFVPKGRYEVRTTVTLEGRLLLASDRRYPVPQDAAYRHVDVQMQRLLPLAATVEASVPLLLTHWRLVEMAGEALSRPADGVSVPHLVFQADEPRVAGSGGCNRFLADYELQPQSGHLRMGQLVSNISLCLQSSGLETQYFEALLAVRGFRQVGTQLLLRGPKASNCCVLKPSKRCRARLQRGFWRVPLPQQIYADVSRSRASRYFAAVFSITAWGRRGDGGVLSQGLPLTWACSSQSRTNCLS